MRERTEYVVDSLSCSTARGLAYTGQEGRMTWRGEGSGWDCGLLSARAVYMVVVALSTEGDMPWSPQALRRVIVWLKVMTGSRVSVTAPYDDWHSFLAIVAVSKHAKFYYSLATGCDQDALTAIDETGPKPAIEWTQRVLVEAWFRCWIAGKDHPMDIMGSAYRLVDEMDLRLDLEGVRRRVKER